MAKIYKRGSKKPYKRFSKKRGRAPVSMKRLRGMISRISLKKVETKHTHTIVENSQLYHNQENINYSLLYTQQGVSDADTGTSNYVSRVGNEVIARGVSIRIWVANKLDRPNVMYRIVIFRYRAGTTIGSAYRTQGSSNYMLREIDPDKIKVLATKTFNLQVGVSAIPNGDVTNNWNRREAHKIVKFWIPLKNQKIIYDGDNSGTPRFTDIGFSIVPYDSYGTLTTDNIASYSFIHKFYFKDP